MGRFRDAWQVLRGYRLEYEDETVAEEAVPAGPTKSARCIDTEGDVIACRGVKKGPHGACVVVQMKHGDNTGMVVLKPSGARAFAAGMLDAADESDGTTPLLFTSNDIVPGVRAVLDLIAAKRDKGAEHVVEVVEHWGRNVLQAAKEGESA